MNRHDELAQAKGLSWPDNSPRWVIAFCVVILCGLAVGLRCLHLLNADHYYIVSPDSHYFHRMAQLLVEGETYFYPTHGHVLPITMFSGITYPVAAIAMVSAFLTPASPGDALEVVSRLLPPALGAVTVIVLYLAVSRIWGRVAGLLTAFSWAVLPWGIVHQASGYLDRDCLSIVLVVSGVFLFYFLTESTTAKGLARFSWVACALGVVGVEAALYVEWGFLGPAILIATILSFFFLQILKDVSVRAGSRALPLGDAVPTPPTIGRAFLAAIHAVLGATLTRTVGLILAINLAALAFRPAIFRTMYDLGVDVFGKSTAGRQEVTELRGIDLGDVLSLSFLLLPALIGVCLCAKRRTRADLLPLAWFGVLSLSALVATRLFIYAMPAACILSGIGFAALLNVKAFRPSLAALLEIPALNWRRLAPYLRMGLACLLAALAIFMSLGFGYYFASTPPMAADNDWYGAMMWLRDETPRDAVVMTWWSGGYWILDIAQRVPVVDNGVHHEAREPADTDIARVYCARDDSEAIDIMRCYGADYVVFSKVEMRSLPWITLRALNVAYGDGKSIPEELTDSLYSRSFSETFESDAGIQRVYQSPGAPDRSVVILEVG